MRLFRSKVAKIVLAVLGTVILIAVIAIAISSQLESGEEADQPLAGRVESRTLPVGIGALPPRTEAQAEQGDAEAEMPPDSAPAKLREPAATPTSGAETNASAPGAPLERKIERNVTLSMIVASPRSAVSELERTAAGIPGAYIARTELQEEDASLPTTVVLRIPVEAYDDALAQIRRLATEIFEEQVASADVTDEFTDVSSQLRNLRAAEEQLQVLMGRAVDAEDVASIFDRLYRIRGEIEVLQGRLNLLENRVALATVIVLLYPFPDLSLTLAPEGVPSFGSSTRFVLSYRNVGSVRAKNVEVTLDVPDRLRFEWAESDGKYDPALRKVSWDLDTLDAGSFGILEASLFIDSPAGAVVPLATILASTPDRDPSNNKNETRIEFFVDLAISVQAPPSVAQGERAEVLLDFANLGTADATGVTITATVPRGATFVNASSGGSYDPQTSKVTWKLGKLVTDESDQVSMTIRVDAVTGQLETATAIYADGKDAAGHDNAASALISAVKEDFSGREFWNPAETWSKSLSGLSTFGRVAGDVFIWVMTFAIPLAAVVLVVGAPIVIVRRRRARSKS